METTEQPTPPNLHAGLQKIRRRRWFLWLLILAYLPAMMVALRSPQSGQIVVAVFCVWLFLLVIAVALMALARCPQCGECFHMNGFLFRPVRRCFHCGLHLNGSRPESPQ